MIELTDESLAPKKKTAAALGFFDGLHFGHRAVINKAAELADSPNAAFAVFTFNAESFPLKGGYILSQKIKTELLAGLGAEYIYSPEFEEIKNMSGGEFIRNILRDKLNAVCAVCGEDFRFGKNASCGAEELENLCGQYGIKVCVLPPVKTESGEKVSSTMIKRLLAEGKITEANSLLGTEFALRLPVSKGRQLGRTLGFPTINQRIPERQALPKFGVYASEAEVFGKRYKSVTNIGVKPTVGSDAPAAETHIAGFDGELYGETVKITLRSFIRPEKKFADTDELKKQIAEDIRISVSINDTENRKDL